MGLYQVGQAVGDAIQQFGNYSAQAAAKANAVSAGAQTAQGNFNKGQAEIANNLGTDRLAEMYQFNSGQAAMANAFTAEMWDKMAAFNHNEAKLQRDWQERMANTAYQRAVKDMIAAGLNPALAVTGGGISTGTPSGATASVGSAQGVAASGSALNGISASEGSYSGQMEYMGGTLGLLAAAISGIGSGMQALGNLGDLGKGFGDMIGSIFDGTIFDKDFWKDEDVKGGSTTHPNGNTGITHGGSAGNWFKKVLGIIS